MRLRNIPCIISGFLTDWETHIMRLYTTRKVNWKNILPFGKKHRMVKAKTSYVPTGNIRCFLSLQAVFLTAAYDDFLPMALIFVNNALHFTPTGYIYRRKRCRAVVTASRDRVLRWRAMPAGKGVIEILSSILKLGGL